MSSFTMPAGVDKAFEFGYDHRRNMGMKGLRHFLVTHNIPFDPNAKQAELLTQVENATACWREEHSLNDKAYLASDFRPKDYSIPKLRQVFSQYGIPVSGGADKDELMEVFHDMRETLLRANGVEIHTPGEEGVRLGIAHLGRHESVSNARSSVSRAAGQTNQPPVQTSAHQGFQQARRAAPAATNVPPVQTPAHRGFQQARRAAPAATNVPPVQTPAHQGFQQSPRTASAATKVNFFLPTPPPRTPANRSQFAVRIEDAEDDEHQNLRIESDSSCQREAPVRPNLNPFLQTPGSRAPHHTSMDFAGARQAGAQLGQGQPMTSSAQHAQAHVFGQPSPIGVQAPQQRAINMPVAVDEPTQPAASTDEASCQQWWDRYQSLQAAGRHWAAKLCLEMATQSFKP